MAQPSWKTDRAAQDATAEWAIPHLRGVAKESRLDTLTMLVINHKLDVTAEELDSWCHRFEHPDIASGLALKDTEGHAKAIEHRAVSMPEETGSLDDGDVDDATASRLRAEGFRTFAELLVPTGPAIRYSYPRRRQGTQTRWRKKVGKGARWETLGGGGSVTLADGEVVPYVTSVTIGIRGGLVIWALPEVGPERVWYHPQTHAIEFERRKVESAVSRSVIGTRAMALARAHAPGAVDHQQGAAMAKALGLNSRQLLHYHQAIVEEEIGRRTRKAAEANG